MTDEETEVFDNLVFKNDSYEMLIHGYIKKWVHGIFYGFLLGLFVGCLFMKIF